VTQGISASSGIVQYEMKIPLSTVLHSGPGSAIGLFLEVLKLQSSTYDGLWPQEVALRLLPDYKAVLVEGPFDYGDLVLANPAAQTANVTFRVSVPSNTPTSAVVYITGGFNSWNAAANAMTKTGANQWETTLPFTSGQVLEYKYTRGTSVTVEKGPLGEEISNRTLAVPGSDFTQNDVVANWADVPNGVSENADRKVAVFNLGQNYPNPFNPSTTIPFDVKEPCRVVLKVYDVAGREVSRIIDANYSPGAYRVQLDAKGFAPGIYLYRVEMSHFRAMRKMVVVE
jgi:hypothetical protein